jgi:hypothetical protein
MFPEAAVLGKISKQFLLKVPLYIYFLYNGKEALSPKP